MLINATKVREYALSIAPIHAPSPTKSLLRKKTQVSKTFLEAVDYEARQAVIRRVGHHDNKCGGRKTLV